MSAGHGPAPASVGDAPTASPTARVALFALAAIGALGIGALLVRLLFIGQAHSYDAMLYARSLWGVAHGDWFNPVGWSSSLAIHGQWFLLPLAPLARLLPAALVLALAQAAAFGLTLWVVGTEAHRIAQRAAGHAASLPIAVWFTVIVAACPLVLNPFLFDARPDLIAVPLATAAFVRARRVGVDGWVLAACVGASLAREEFAVVMAAALVLIPCRADDPFGWRRRVLAAGALVIYFAAYFWGARAVAVAGGSQELAQRSVEMLAGRVDSGAVPVWDISPFAARIELVLVAAAAGGGLALIGWRWATLALPGLAVLLSIQWMYDSVISFHYGMFAAPGLLVASLAGLDRWADYPLRSRALTALLGTVVAGIAYQSAAAAPGGGRFVPHHFALERGLEADYPEHETAHTVLSMVPADAGLSVPFAYGAPVADRQWIFSNHWVAQWLQNDWVPPEELRWVAVLPQRWDTLGHRFVGRHGFHLATAHPESIGLLTRDPSVPIPWEQVAAIVPPRTCDAPQFVWPSKGLGLCEPWRGPEDRIQVSFWRAPDARVDEGAERLVLMLITEDAEPQPVTILDGLVTPDQLPPGRGVTARSRRAAPLRGELLLVAADGDVVSGRVTSEGPDASPHGALRYDLSGR